MCIDSCPAANSKSQFKCGLCSVEYCSEQCAITDWSQKHQFECVGARDGEEKTKKRERGEEEEEEEKKEEEEEDELSKRTQPLILNGLDGNVVISMKMVRKSSTLIAMLKDYPTQERIELKIRREVLQAIFAETKDDPNFENLEQLSEFLNASNYLGIGEDRYERLMGQFKKPIIESLINSTNAILMTIVRQYFFQLLTIQEIRAMLNIEELDAKLRKMLMNQLIERAIVLFPRTFAKWGTQDLSEEQIDAILEVLFIHDNAEGQKYITRREAQETYAIPETAFRGLNRRQIRGQGMTMFFDLNDILDIVISKHDSLTKMRNVKQQKQEKKVARRQKKDREEEEDKKTELRLFEEVKRALIAKHGPKIERYIEAVYDRDGFWVGTRLTFDQVMDYIQSRLINKIQKSITEQLKLPPTESIYEIYNNALNFYLNEENIKNVYRDIQLFERYFVNLFRKILSRLDKLKTIFQKNGIQFSRKTFFYRYTSMIKDLSEENLISTILSHYDGVLNNLIQTRDYQKLSEFLTPEKYVEVYEQIQGRGGGGFFFANLELTPYLWDSSFSL
jgi:hypothetical protein